MYYDALNFMKKYKNKNTFFILSNSDIFFDKSLNNLDKLNMDNSNEMLSLSRYEYNPDKPLKESKLFTAASQSQDTWILHSNNLSSIKKLTDFKFNLGIWGCDNHVAYLFKKNNLNQKNYVNIIKTYHLHSKRFEKDGINKTRINKKYHFLNPDYKKLY